MWGRLVEGGWGSLGLRGGCFGPCVIPFGLGVGERPVLRWLVRWGGESGERRSSVGQWVFDGE